MLCTPEFRLNYGFINGNDWVYKESFSKNFITKFSKMLQKCTVVLIIISISQVFGQKLLVCQVTGNTCTFKEKIVNKNEQVVIVADNKGSTTNADIKEVKFEASSIYSVPTELFTIFKNLEGLSMAGQEVQEIKPNTFKSAINLKRLNLANNLLRKIDEETFDGAYKITHLHLDSNK
jgi:Leucine-rich repeat (LRR) protein